MLQELANYAEQKGLQTKPGFKAKKATWIIVMTNEGDYVDIIKNERDFSLCPHLEQPELIAKGITKSHFLLDNLYSVTGYMAEGAKEKDKHNYFKSLLDISSVYDESLKKCSTLVNNEQIVNEINSKLKSLKAKPTETATFQVGNIYPINLKTWHSWWQSFRESLVEQKTQRKNSSMICFLSGESVEPIKTHSKITGLTNVGGQPSGASLISFDKDSFTSYGLDKALNAACSEKAVATYSSALMDLINKAPMPLGNTLYFHWYKEPISEEDDLLDFSSFGFSESNEFVALSKVNKIFNSLKEGNRPEYTHNTYYILQLSATGGRIMIRDWLTGDFSELVQNIRKWYNDLQIISPNGKGETNGFKLIAAVIRLTSYRPKESVSDTIRRGNNELAPFMPRLYRSIILGLPLPSLLLQKSLVYIRSKVLQSDNDKKDNNLDWIACAMLKAWIVRNEELSGGVPNMKSGLNKEHPSTAYHAGRMMAILAEIQRSALGNVGAGVIQKHYPAASTTPALVMGRLVKMAQFHLDKLEKGLAFWYEDWLAEISSKMGDSLPVSLTLEEQALFALGYYQQKASMWQKLAKNGEEGSEESLEEGN